MQEKQSKSSEELIDLKEELSSAQEIISLLQKENVDLRVQVYFSYNSINNIYSGGEIQ